MLISLLILFVIIAASAVTTWYLFMHHGLWYALGSYVVSFLVFFWVFPPPNVGLGILEWFIGTIILFFADMCWDWLWSMHLKRIIFPKKKVEEEKEEEKEYPDFFGDRTDPV